MRSIASASGVAVHDPGATNGHLLDRTIFCAGLDKSHALDDAKPVFHASKDGVLSIQPWSLKIKLDYLQLYPHTGANVTKNCEPLVLGPLFAMLRMPAPVCFRPG